MFWFLYPSVKEFVMHEELNLFKLMLEASLVVKLVVLILIFSSVVSWAIAIFKQKQFRSVTMIIRSL